MTSSLLARYGARGAVVVEGEVVVVVVVEVVVVVVEVEVVVDDVVVVVVVVVAATFLAGLPQAATRSNDTPITATRRLTVR